jgi:hypothetical protein
MHSLTARAMGLVTSDMPTNEMVRRCNPPLQAEDISSGFIRRIIDMQIRSVGIDLAKTTFHLVALGASGKVLVKKKFSQKQGMASKRTRQPVSIRRTLQVSGGRME